MKNTIHYILASLFVMGLLGAGIAQAGSVKFTNKTEETIWLDRVDQWCNYWAGIGSTCKDYRANTYKFGIRPGMSFSIGQPLVWYDVSIPAGKSYRFKTKDGSISEKIHVPADGIWVVDIVK